MAAAAWQDPLNFATTNTAIQDVYTFLDSPTDAAKPGDLNWRELQKQCWGKYKTFGPLNSAVDSKADYVAQANFSIYSDILEVNEFLKDLVYSYRNKLYAKAPGWIVRMLGECELFLLLVIDELGNSTVRSLEPQNIGSGTRDTGLYVDVDDITQTLFYRHKTKSVDELIPDARFVLEPELMTERLKETRKASGAAAGGTTFSEDKINPLTRGTGAYNKIGGYRRFILHWKNLTGIHEYKRDTAGLVTTLEWINLYTNALKWELDHKRASCAYTVEIQFSPDLQGKIAWTLWQKMTPEARSATGLTGILTPGSRVFMMPGMSLKIHAPQLPTLSGSNQDLLNLSGAGAKTPQDMWQGQSAGATYASIRSSRPPLIAEIENLQSKFENFLRYEFLRVCFKAKTMLNPTVINAVGVKYKLLESYKVPWVESAENGSPAIKEIDVEPCEIVRITFPNIQLEVNPEAKANALFGSKHAGLQAIGVSNDRLARSFGIDDLSREKNKQFIEEAKYGKNITGTEAEKKAEGAFSKKGAEGEGEGKNKQNTGGNGDLFSEL